MIIKDLRETVAAYFGEINNTSHLKIDGTTYEVTTHFSDNENQNILQQFKELILSDGILED